VLHLLTADGQAFNMFGPESLNCQLLDRVADCVAPEEGGYYVEGTAELVLSLDPDVILLVNYTDDLADPAGATAALAGNPLWAEVRAAREGRVHALPYDARASSVWGVGNYLDLVAPLIHPDAFPTGPLTEDQVAAALQE
jgi:ABC-type Fe3+-hydroxamate transport system substrate-binding protein